MGCVSIYFSGYSQYEIPLWQEELHIISILEQLDKNES